MGSASSYEEETKLSLSKLMFSSTEINFQRNLLSELQACLKGKCRHLHFMRYSSHIQKMLTAQRLHYHNLALSARTVSYRRFSGCSRYCSICEPSYLAMTPCWAACEVLQKPLWLPSIHEGMKPGPPPPKMSPPAIQEAQHRDLQGLRVEHFSSAHQPHL